MNAPVLFMCSQKLSKSDSLFYLKDLGKVLVLGDEKIKNTDVQAYKNYDFIICNYKDKEEVERLRFIDLSAVIRVCLLRSYESSSDDWVTKSHSDYIIKSMDFVDKCSNKNELLNFIKHLSNYKQPVNDVWFWSIKAWSVFRTCLGRNK